ncbi:MAG: alpha/beta hydrolase [Alcanivoracaceae bacterium]|nr:alpha/beta hydrolase [Alcanivoracaceae bacterium]
MPFVKMRDGQSIYVRAIGRGQPVLMLPGLGMTSRQWLPFVLPHIGAFRFYMPDFRGHGRSRKAELNQADVFQNHADDVQDVIAHFQLHDYLLVGISLGATTSMHLQRETGFNGVRRYLHIDQSPCVLNDAQWTHGLTGTSQEELFRRMAPLKRLLDAFPGYEYFDQLPAPAKRDVANALADMAEVLGVGKIPRAIVRNGFAKLPSVIVRRIPLMRLRDMALYLAAYSGGGHDYRATLRAGSVPVTLMYGKHSPLYHADGQKLVASNAAESKVVCFERSGHVPLLDEPRKFMREFSRFLRD